MSKVMHTEGMIWRMLNKFNEPNRFLNEGFRFWWISSSLYINNHPFLAFLYVANDWYVFNYHTNNNMFIFAVEVKKRIISPKITFENKIDNEKWHFSIFNFQMIYYCITNCNLKY